MNARLVRLLILSWALSALAGCGKEVGRIPFSSEATKTTALMLASGSVSFWTELDVDYLAPAALQYRIDLRQHGASVASAVCDPLGPKDTKLSWLEIERGRRRSQRGEGKMQCRAVVPAPGPTSVEATLAFSACPAACTLRRADLVIKQ